MGGERSVVHMLTGHAFSCALYANILTAVALIMETSGYIDNIDTDHSGNLYKALLNQDLNALDIAYAECTKQLHKIISQVLDQVASQSRTEKLWVSISAAKFVLKGQGIGDYTSTV